MNTYTPIKIFGRIIYAMTALGEWQDARLAGTPYFSPIEIDGDDR